MWKYQFPISGHFDKLNDHRITLKIIKGEFSAVNVFILILKFYKIF